MPLAMSDVPERRCRRSAHESVSIGAPAVWQLKPFDDSTLLRFSEASHCCGPMCHSIGEDAGSLHELGIGELLRSPGANEAIRNLQILVAQTRDQRLTSQARLEDALQA